MEFNSKEAEMIRRILGVVDDWSFWDDEEYNYETEVQPLLKKLNNYFDEKEGE